MEILYGPMAGGVVIFTCLLYLVMSCNIGVLLPMIFCLLIIFIIFLYQLPRILLSVGLALGSQPTERASQPENRKPTKLKLLFDKNRSRVLYMECDKDFVDVLLSFLVLPMGTIIRLADRESRIGSMDELYKSEEALHIECFRTKACKNMLLQPRSAYGLRCNKLIVKVDEMDYTKFYTCSKTPCSKIVSFGLASFVENSICASGKAMDYMRRMNFADGKVDRGFITRAQRFMITDHFQVLPESISYAPPVLLRHRINDNSGVEVENYCWT